MNLKQAFITIGMMVGSATLALTSNGCSGTGSPTSGTVFTADEEGKAISVVNLETGQVGTTGIGVSPHNVQTSRDGRTLFAVGSTMAAGQAMGDGMTDRGRLLIFDASKVSSGPTANIEVGRGPTHVIVDAQGARAFVPNAGDNVISVVDLQKRQVIKSIAVGKSPHGLRMSPNAQTIFVANTDDGTVSVLSVADLIEVARIPVGKGPVQVGFTPDGNRSYVSLRDENSVAVIDTASRRVVAKIPVGPGPIQIFAAPNGREIYVANQGTKAAPGNTMSIIDTASQKVVSEIVTGAGAHGVVVNGSGDRVFVTNVFANTVSVIDPVRRKVIRNIAVGAGPGGVTYAIAN